MLWIYSKSPAQNQGRKAKKHPNKQAEEPVRIKTEVKTETLTVKTELEQRIFNFNKSFSGFLQSKLGKQSDKARSGIFKKKLWLWNSRIFNREKSDLNTVLQRFSVISE
jgi:hypothetical protein